MIDMYILFGTNSPLGINKFSPSQRPQINPNKENSKGPSSANKGPAAALICCYAPHIYCYAPNTMPTVPLTILVCLL
jgi:hypothetical protein